MTVVKSDIVTDADNKDIQVDERNYSGEKAIIATYTAAGVIADNDIILMCQIPVDAKITSIRHFSDDLGTTGDLGLGLYPGAGSGIKNTDLVVADALDEDLFAVAIDVNAAALANVEQRFNALDHKDCNDKAYELGALTTRPDYGSFYLAYTASEATTAGGDITVIVRYL